MHAYVTLMKMGASQDEHVQMVDVADTKCFMGSKFIIKARVAVVLRDLS